MAGAPWHSVAEEIEGRIAAASNPDRAVNEKKYLKSELQFYGSGVPVIRKAVRATLRDSPPRDLKASLALSTELWSRSHHELRSAAVEVLCLAAAEMEPADLARVEVMLRQSKTWALVDTLAVKVVGTMFENHSQLGKELDRWSKDHDFWLRRSSMLALLQPLRKGGGDFDRFCQYAESMLDETEFFIRKAIGWILREVSKVRPELVVEFLECRISRVSGVTIREAVRYLDVVDRKRFLAAYRSR